MPFHGSGGRSALCRGRRPRPGRQTGPNREHDRQAWCAARQLARRCAERRRRSRRRSTRAAWLSEHGPVIRRGTSRPGWVPVRPRGGTRGSARRGRRRVRYARPDQCTPRAVLPEDRNLEVDAAVGSGRVAMPEIGGEDALQVMTVPDHCPVQTLGAHGTHSTFGIGVARGARGGIFNCLDTNSGEHRVERGGELGVAVADHKPEPLNVFVEVHQQVTGRLGHTHRSGGR